MNQSEFIVLPSHAGVDEAGRGCLVGSVFAAAVMLPTDYALHGLTDSKKLSEKKREALAVEIKQQAIAWSVAAASPAEIAQYNILQATLLAMTRAIAGLAKQPAFVWIDGNCVPKNLTMPAQAVVQGDSKIATISAASILAKTARDAEMYALHERYP
ncbi:ribonuclease HII, partial [Kingella kingae]|uniref:ribonuclease HII n=1 Tax=Kingella kingae TaxID=504 RepID=UPI00254EE5EC